MVEEIKADMKYAEDNGHCADAIRFNRQMNFAREEIDEYWNSIPLERRQAICAAERDGRCVVLPKDAHQPAFVKSDAIDIFDQWNDITGAIPNGTSWYYEAQSVVEEVAAMAFGAGVFYEAERREAAPAQEGGQEE